MNINACYTHKKKSTGRVTYMYYVCMKGELFDHSESQGTVNTALPLLLVGYGLDDNMHLMMLAFR